MEDNQSVGGYIRVENRKDTSKIDSQRNSIDDFAKSKGLNIRDYFIDEAEIDTPLHKRSGYSKLNDAIVSGKVNTVLIYSMDRFTDDEREKQGLFHNFAEKGVELYVSTTGEHINPSEPLTREQRLLAEAMRDMEDIKAKSGRQ